MTTTQVNPSGSADYRSPLSRMLYDSPLHTRRGKVIFAAIIAIVLFLSAQAWIRWLTPLSNTWIVLAGIFFASLGSWIGLAILRYLDRREPESWWYWIGALLFALLFTTAPAAVLNNASPAPLLTVGFNEEFWKALPLLLLVFFAPTMVNGVRDGIIYGALGGFAFNIVEIANYFLKVSYPERGLDGLSDQLARLGFWGIGNHVIWSMLVGAGIGLAVQSKSRPTRILAPLGAYLLAAITHDIQDIGGGALLMVAATTILISLQGANVDPTDQAAVRELSQANIRPAMQIEAFLINVFILPIILYALVKSGNWERAVIRDELADEVGEVITPEEYEGVEAEKRFRLRRVPGFSRGTARKIRNAQNGLAFQKAYLKRKGRLVDGDPLAEYYRAEVARLRGA